jgi:hypothetical protein
MVSGSQALPGNGRIEVLLRVSMNSAMPNIKHIAVISGLLSLLSALGVEWYPQVFEVRDLLTRGTFASFFWFGTMSVVLGYGCRGLDAVLHNVLHGNDRPAQPAEFDPGPALASFVKWSVCFLAGPAFLLYEALRFWTLRGDLTITDGLILVELTVPAIGYWLVGVLVLSCRPDLVVPLPWQVLKIVVRLGWRAVPAGIVLTAAAAIHLWLGLSALLLLENSWIVGMVLLWICWFSVWQCGALTVQTLGAWYVGVRQIQTQRRSVSPAG